MKYVKKIVIFNIMRIKSIIPHRQNKCKHPTVKL